MENNRDRRGGLFRRECRRVATFGDDHIDLAADELGGQPGQPIEMTLRPAIFDGDVVPFDIAHLAQPVAETGEV